MAEPLPSFVARRRNAWSELERLLGALDSKTIAAAQLRELDLEDRRAAADLGRAQALYPGTDAQRFLNQLCARAYGSIYAQRTRRADAMRAFFARDFPLAVQQELAYVGASAALLFLGALVGIVALLIRPELAAL